MYDVLDLRDILLDELIQRREEGYDVTQLEEQVQQAVTNSTDAELAYLYGLLEQTTRRADWPYYEPSTLTEIHAVLPATVSLPPLTLDDNALQDPLLAAWLGRCAGCNLGKPVEGWSRVDIRCYLEAAHAYPLDNYLPVLASPPDGLQLQEGWEETTRGSIHFMARDDDIDFTILGLYILETYGFDFGPQQVATTWLSLMPFLTSSPATG